MRTLTRNGEPWFVAADVCDALGLTNPTMAVENLDEDERMTLSLTEGHSGQRGGARSLNIISESGVYALIFRSNKPEARAFRKWITAEVLPAIRKTGGYFLAEGSEQAFLRAETEREIAALTDRRNAITLEIRRLRNRYDRIGGDSKQLRIVTASPRLAVEAVLDAIPEGGIRVGELQRLVCERHSASQSTFYRTWALAKPHVVKQPDGSVARKGGAQ